MIKEESIQRVFDAADIVEVVGDFLELKKSGSNRTALSPFTQEKTPSFMVSPSKQIYKCFSSGKGGGAVSFLQEHKGMTFPEAIEHLAQKYNVQLEYEGKEISQEEKDKQKRLELCLRSAKNRWQKALDKDGCLAMTELLENRKLDKETILEWELGFAPDSYSFIKDPLLQAGYYHEGIELGLIRRKNENTYDFFRNRLIFPIRNHKGELVGFGGRTMGDDKAKYLNSPESAVFKKAEVLYGLDRAINGRIDGKSVNHIRESGKVYLTEGYFDVISMHQAGLKNTVATCGTSLLVIQARLLMRHTKHFVLLRDGDNAGRKAALRDCQRLMEMGCKVDICLMDEGDDPDSLCRKFTEAPQPVEAEN